MLSVQVAAKEAELTRLANDVDSLGLQLGQARGELAKQVCVTPSSLNFQPCCKVTTRSCSSPPPPAPHTDSAAVFNQIYQRLQLDPRPAFLKCIITAKNLTTAGCRCVCVTSCDRLVRCRRCSFRSWSRCGRS